MLFYVCYITCVVLCYNHVSCYNKRHVMLCYVCYITYVMSCYVI